MGWKRMTKLLSGRKKIHIQIIVQLLPKETQCRALAIWTSSWLAEKGSLHVAGRWVIIYLSRYQISVCCTLRAEIHTYCSVGMSRFGKRAKNHHLLARSHPFSFDAPFSPHNTLSHYHNWQNMLDSHSGRRMMRGITEIVPEASLGGLYCLLFVESVRYMAWEHPDSCSWAEGWQ